jgi:2,4-dienoyl-CoA reductase-like NADH-dependent reductase (Old Yellow Enzyme family)
MHDRARLDPLSWPLRLAGTTVRGRIMCSAMTLQYGHDGLISERHLAYYRERAAGGVALQLSEQLTATPLSVGPFVNAMAAYDERQVERFAAVAEALKAHDTRFFAQLFAAGAAGKASIGLEGWGPVRGPSRIGVPGGEAPLPLTRGEIEQIVADFALSARHVKAGGLDGVEVHGAHGWLIGQFLSPFYNRRDDDYGGTVENRCRLALEIARALRAEVGEDFPLGLALSYDEMIGPAGITEHDTLAQLELLSAASVYDFFDLSVGSAHSEHYTIAPMDLPEGFALDFAARAKKAVGDRAAIFVAGRIVDPAMAAQVIQDGGADMVAMSRAHLADPHIVRKAAAGRRHEIRRCVGANVCVARALSDQPVACVLTPRTGRELTWESLKPVARGAGGRILIIGGGPAGLHAGAVAAARGHIVEVHERESAPGGHLRDLAWLPRREGWNNAIEDMVSALRRAGGTLRVGTHVDVDALAHASADVVLLAVGAEWQTIGASPHRLDRAGIGGLSSDRVVALDVALGRVRENRLALGKRVLIVDETGEYLPLGLAEALAEGGAEVEVASVDNSIGSAAAITLELPYVLSRLRRLEVALTIGWELVGIDGNTVELADRWSGMTKRCEAIDTVVLSTGRVPRQSPLEARARVGKQVRRIGDALAPRTTTEVIHEAEVIARAL